MKKSLFVSLCLLLSVAVCHAGGLKIGGHGAYTVGGDVEDEEAGGGAQIAIGFNDSFSMELAGTMIQDSVGNVDVDFFTIALSARVGGMLSEGLGAYAGGGINYNFIEIDGFEDPDGEAGFHACAGLEIPLAENLELFGEYRFTWVEYTVDDSGGDLTFEGDVEYNFGLARAGLNLVF